MAISEYLIRPFEERALKQSMSDGWLCLSDLFDNELIEESMEGLCANYRKDRLQGDLIFVDRETAIHCIQDLANLIEEPNRLIEEIDKWFYDWEWEKRNQPRRA